MAKELSKRRAGRNRNKMRLGSIFDPAQKNISDQSTEEKNTFD